METVVDFGELMRGLLTTREAADVLGLSDSTVTYYVRRKYLRQVKIADRNYYRADEVEALREVRDALQRVRGVSAAGAAGSED